MRDGGPEDLGQGGGKKFLYGGRKQQRNDLFDDEEVAPAFPSKTQWSYSKPQDHTSVSNNDLDDVWSIRKNVAIKQTTQKPSATEGWNLNVKKGYYSRHGGLADDSAGTSNNSSTDPTKLPIMEKGRSNRFSFSSNQNEFVGHQAVNQASRQNPGQLRKGGIQPSGMPPPRNF